MALINCPNCKQKISDQLDACNHCGVQLKQMADSSSEAPTASQLKLRRMKQTYSLQMQAMAGVILFLVGIFLWYFVGQQGLTKLSHFLELTLAGIGAVWYLITRIRIIARR